jgi:hypothetical protein
MEDNAVIVGLQGKRAEIQHAINDIECEAQKQVRAHRAVLGKIDAAIELFEPGVIAAKRKQSMCERQSSS